MSHRHLLLVAFALLIFSFVSFVVSVQKSARAAYDGDTASTTFSPGSPVTPGATGAGKTIVSFNVPPGKWIANGVGVFSPGTILTLGLITIGISDTADTQPSLSTAKMTSTGITNVVNSYNTPINVKINNNTTMSQTYYLVGSVTYLTLGTALWSIESLVTLQKDGT